MFFNDSEYLCGDAYQSNRQKRKRTVHLASSCSRVFMSHTGLVAVMAVKPKEGKKNTTRLLFYKIKKYDKLILKMLTVK